MNNPNLSRIAVALFVLVVVLQLHSLLLNVAGAQTGDSPVVPFLKTEISIVYPHDGQGHATTVAQSRAVNVSIWPTDRVSCTVQSYERQRQLYVTKNNEPGQFVRKPQVIQLARGGVTFPTLEFDNVSADLAADPTSKYRFMLPWSSNVWVHATDARTFYPSPVEPIGLASPGPLSELDTRIQMVWPHDAQGRYAPVDRAPFVNIAVDVLVHGTRLSVPLDFPALKYADVRQLYLMVAKGNAPARKLGMPGRPELSWQPQKVTYSAKGLTFPRWVFNDVPVQPGEQYNFLVQMDSFKSGPDVYPTLWTHAADARTLMPAPPVPPACAS